MDNVEVLANQKTPMMQAQEELAREDSKKAVELLKIALKKKKAAELVVKNIDREIEDLNERIAQGDLG